MSDPIWTGSLKCLQSFFNTISLFFNQPARNHKTGSIEPIMTMHANLWVYDPLGPRLIETFFDDSNKPRDVFFRGRYLSSCWIFVIGYWCVVERRWIICRIHSSRNVDYMPNFGVLTDKMEGRMSSIRLSECLNEP